MIGTIMLFKNEKFLFPLKYIFEQEENKKELKQQNSSYLKFDEKNMDSLRNHEEQYFRLLQKI